MTKMIPFGLSEVLDLKIKNSKEKTVAQKLIKKAWSQLGFKERVELETNRYKSWIQYERTDEGQCLFLVYFQSQPESPSVELQNNIKGIQ